MCDDSEDCVMPDSIAIASNDVSDDDCVVADPCSLYCPLGNAFLADGAGADLEKRVTAQVVHGKQIQHCDEQNKFWSRLGGCIF